MLSLAMSVRPSVVCRNTFGSNRSAGSNCSKNSAFTRVKSADSCLNGAIAGNSNCKLQIYATYDFLQTNLCARF